MIIQMESVIVR